MKTVAKIIDNKIVAAVDRQVNEKIGRALPQISSKIKPEVSSIILRSLSESPTVQSLLSGKLKDDFGLFGNVVDTTINNIISVISEGINVKLERSKTAGSIVTTTLEILPYKDFDKIISVAGGSFPARGGNVDWLEWLLTRGTQVVIGDFWLFEHARGFTRSGGSSIMRRIENIPREPFRVDSNFSGTIDDNFITRAIQSQSDELLRVLGSAVNRSFN